MRAWQSLQWESEYIGYKSLTGIPVQMGNANVDQSCAYFDTLLDAGCDRLDACRVCVCRFVHTQLDFYHFYYLSIFVLHIFLFSSSISILFLQMVFIASLSVYSLKRREINW